MNKKMWAIKIVTSLSLLALAVMLLLEILPSLLFVVLEIAVLAASFILQYLVSRNKKNLDEGIQSNTNSGGTR